MRPARVWFWFGLLAAIAFFAMAWMSVSLIVEERRAALEAETTERVRIALWRMDSAAADVIAIEGARPYFVYRALYPVGRAYDAVYAPVRAGEALRASPLLLETPAYVLAHFEIGPDLVVTSPQTPEGAMLEVALARGASAASMARAREELGAVRAVEHLLVTDAFRSAADAAIERAQKMSADEADASFDSDVSSRQELAGRAQTQNRMIAEQRRRDLSPQMEASGKAAGDAGEAFASRAPEQSEALADEESLAALEGVMEAGWVDDLLVLRRTVTIDGARYIQGALLDAEALESMLLDEVRDLLPRASLSPADGDVDGGALLASMPLALSPGGIAKTWTAPRPRVLTPLLAAWAALLVTGLAVGALLRGVLSLSERRASFVSTVTHELRSPLTSIRLYADLLSEGGLADEAERGKAIATMRREASRLSRLLENVLSFARLEKKAATPQTEVLRIGDVIDRSLPSLTERCAQASMELAIEDGAWRESRARVHPEAMEQILFNLVDNACKYAAGAEDARVVVSGDVKDGRVLVRVRDHGPGIDAADRRRLFRAFSKSAERAAEGSRGVGLGLALSRRLARSMGGELKVVDVEGGGGCFEVELGVG